MFPDWSSLHGIFQDDRTFQSSLTLLPREVVVEICKNVCKSLVPKPTTAVPAATTVFQTPGGLPSSSGDKPPGILESEDLVNYSMEVLAFALSLDFELHEVIRDATFVYCDWLSALSNSPKPSVPDCIRANPNLYCQRIIKQMYNLFVPRERQSQDFVQKQGVLCHRTLRTFQDVFKTSVMLDAETWNVLLQTLLSTCDVMLSRPIELDDFSDYFSKRLLGVLFDLWLTACQRSFPAAVYWKTFAKMSDRWRHRLPVIEEWLRVTVLLFEKANHLVAGKSGANCIVFRSAELMKVFEDWKNTSPISLSDELLVQTQMRMLLLSMSNLGDVVSSDKSAEKKMKALALPPDSFRYSDSSLTQTLAPLIFLKLMTGVTVMVDLAMNMLASIDCYLDTIWPDLVNAQMQSLMLGAQADSGAAAAANVSGESLVVMPKGRPLRCESRIPCRGLLHLFGPWLFQASLAGRIEAGKTDELPDPDKDTPLIVAKDLDLRQPGRAEALGTLCRIFSFFSDGPNLSPGISARMALVVSTALSLEGSVGYALSNTIRNCHDIFRADVKGLETLLPVLLAALELVLLQKIPKQNLYPEISADDLRSAGLHLLSSIISLPKYFDLLPLNDIRTASGKVPKKAKEDMESFGALYYRMLDLVLTGIVIETNSANCMLLLGCLYALFVHPCMEPGMEESSDVRFSNANKIFIALTHLFNSPLWLQDNTLSYACLEFLHTSARYSTKLLDQTTTKLVILTLCRYIQEQAMKPSRNHSKDLHNKIIVAYHCLTAWMLEWPTLLQENEVLTLIADVIETGLTGVRTAKVLKTLQPASSVSARVKEMAELAQLILLEFVGTKDPGSFQYLDSLVTEEDILASLETSTSTRFHYFTIDGSAGILGVLCSTGANGETYMVDRSLSCRRAYCMKFQRLGPVKNPKILRNGDDHKLKEAMRVDVTPTPVKRLRIAEDVDWDFVAFRNEIPGYKNIEKCMADDMLPTFEDVMKKSEKKEKEIMDFLEAFDQIEAEIVFSLPDARSFEPYTPPLPVETTAVTLDSEAIVVSQVLSHLGLKSPAPPSFGAGSLHSPSTIQLNHENPDLRQALADLDKISIRPLDWVFSFYVGRHDHSVEEILRSGDDLERCSQDFLCFLTSLAWPVKVADVMNRCSSNGTSPSNNHGTNIASCLDGKDYCLLRSEISHELGIIVPSSETIRKAVSPQPLSAGGYLEDQPDSKLAVPKNSKIRSFSVDDADSVGGSKSSQLRASRKHTHLPEPRFVCLFVWMETFRDDFIFPAAEMLRKLDMDRLYWQWHSNESDIPPNTAFEYRVISIFPAAHGLYEIRLRNMDGNPLLAAIPLVNGMVLSHSILASLIGDCVVNLFTRKRLALESYSPGQVRRRNMMQDITDRFSLHNVTETSWVP